MLMFGVLRLTREFFTQMEMSPLLVKDFKFGPILGVHGHWVVGFFYRATPTVTQDIYL